VTYSDSYSGGSSVRSAIINDNEATSFNLTLNGPGNISFYWKVSSESGWDFLRFIVNGVDIASISGAVSWVQYSYSLTNNIQYLIKWVYIKDSLGSSGLDCGYVDYIRLNSTTSSNQTQELSTILDSNVNFINDPTNPWTSHTESKVGANSLKAQSSTAQKTAIKTTITEKGVLSWWWKTSSSSASFYFSEDEYGFDDIEKYDNGTQWQYSKYAKDLDLSEDFYFVLNPGSSNNYGLLDGVIFTPCDPISNIVAPFSMERGEYVTVSWWGAEGQTISIYLITSTQNITLTTKEYSYSYGGSYSFNVPNQAELGKTRILIMQKDLPINSFYSSEIEITISYAWVTPLIIVAIAFAVISGLVIIKNKQKISRVAPNFSASGEIGGISQISNSSSTPSVIGMIRNAFSQSNNLPKAIPVRYTKSSEELIGRRVEVFGVTYRRT
jgi:hypothetical protein